MRFRMADFTTNDFWADHQMVIKDALRRDSQRVRKARQRNWDRILGRRSDGATIRPIRGA